MGMSFKTDQSSQANTTAIVKPDPNQKNVIKISLLSKPYICDVLNNTLHLSEL